MTKRKPGEGPEKAHASHYFETKLGPEGLTKMFLETGPPTYLSLPPNPTPI